MKHTINLNGKFNTNMIDEITNKKIKQSNNISISNNSLNNERCTTIYFKDLTDKDNFLNLKQKFKQQLKKYLIKANKYLIIGLGNPNSTFDSLGPQTLKHILVTNHLKNYDLDKKFKLICKLTPNVTANTGIDNYNLIKSISKKEKPDQIIIIDSLISNNLENITKCIQISNHGIDKNNNYHLYKKSLNHKTLKCPVTLIGIPTILETDHLNSIVTVKDIDFFLKRASILIGESLNEVIHNYSFNSDVPL